LPFLLFARLNSSIIFFARPVLFSPPPSHPSPSLLNHPSTFILVFSFLPLLPLSVSSPLSLSYYHPSPLTLSRLPSPLLPLPLLLLSHRFPLTHSLSPIFLTLSFYYLSSNPISHLLTLSLLPSLSCTPRCQVFASALNLFQELELWDEVVTCYQLLQVRHPVLCFLSSNCTSFPHSLLLRRSYSNYFTYIFPPTFPPSCSTSLPLSLQSFLSFFSSNHLTLPFSLPLTVHSSLITPTLFAFFISTFTPSITTLILIHLCICSLRGLCALCVSHVCVVCACVCVCMVCVCCVSVETTQGRISSERKIETRRNTIHAHSTGRSN
jgi:hypothetical protein